MDVSQAVEAWQQRSPDLDIHLQQTFDSLSSTFGVLMAYPEKVLALAGASSRAVCAHLNNNKVTDQ